MSTFTAQRTHARIAFATCALLSAFAGKSVAQQSTDPVWPTPDVFWFRRAVQGGTMWFKVDAQHGAQEPLFDHTRLAAEVTQKTGVAYTALSLPFDEPRAQFVVKYDGSNAIISHGLLAIEFNHGAQHWRCELQAEWDWARTPPSDYECQSDGPRTALGVAADDAPRKSPDGRWVAFVSAHNVAVRSTGADSLRVRVLSTDGTATDAYHVGSLQWSADGKTLSAVRIQSALMNSESATGSVKQFIVRRDWKL